MRDTRDSPIAAPMQVQEAHDSPKAAPMQVQEAYDSPKAAPMQGQEAYDSPKAAPTPMHMQVTFDKSTPAFVCAPPDPTILSRGKASASHEMYDSSKAAPAIGQNTSANVGTPANAATTTSPTTITDTYNTLAGDGSRPGRPTKNSYDHICVRRDAQGSSSPGPPQIAFEEKSILHDGPLLPAATPLGCGVHLETIYAEACAHMAYHGPLSRGTAETVLKGMPPGTYIFRRSTSTAGVVISLNGHACRPL